MTTISKGVQERSAAAAVKAERERDKAQAMQEYEAEKLAVQANIARLRALRLAKEAAERQPTRTPTKKQRVASRSPAARRPDQRHQENG
jgi:hypothetical protein